MHVRELRSLISFRWRLSKQIIMSKNRLHSVVQRFNLNAPRWYLLVDKNLSWWDQQEFSDLTGFQVECDRDIVDHLETQKANVDQKLAELSNTGPWAADMVFLMQIPGFRLLFSMITLAASGDISRFESPKKLVGYAGLGAGVHDSGKKHQDKSIIKEGRKALRWALVKAAWAPGVRSDPNRKAQYEHFKQTKHPNKAIVTAARKMLVSVGDDTLAYKMVIWSQRMDPQRSPWHDPSTVCQIWTPAIRHWPGTHPHRTQWCPQAHRPNC